MALGEHEQQRRGRAIADGRRAGPSRKVNHALVARSLAARTDVEEPEEWGDGEVASSEEYEGVGCRGVSVFRKLFSRLSWLSERKSNSKGLE